MRLDPPFPKYPEYMNGRLKKIDMTARLNDIKWDLEEMKKAIRDSADDHDKLVGG